MKYSILAIGTAIITAVFLLSFQTSTICHESLKYSATKDSISIIELACQRYAKDFSKNPPLDGKSLASALTGNNNKNIIYLNPQDVPIENGEFVDAWHSPFQPSRDDSYDFIFRSAGGDKKFHTKDDYVNL